MHSDEPVLRAHLLTKSFGGRTVVREVSFALQPGERVAIMGPSGSGKSTLLNCLGGVESLDHGELWLLDQPLHTLNQEELAAVRRERLGMVFQFFHLLPTLTARENVELPLLMAGLASRRRAEEVARLLEAVGVAGRAEALPGELSGGEMQRVAIARALACSPRLLLADEPTGNLDSRTGERVLELLQSVCQERRIALIMVTHSEEATRICPRRWHMRDGILTTDE